MRVKEICLKDICDLENGYAFKSEDYISESNTLNCRMSNIRPDGTFDILYHPKYLPDDFVEKYANYLLQDGDLIIAMTDMAGDPKILGVPTVVNTKGYNLLLNQRVGKLTLLDKDINIQYLKLALQSQMARDYFKRFAGGGVQLNVGKKDILNVSLKMVDTEQQNIIVGKFEVIDNLIVLRKQQLSKLDELIKARFVELFGDPVSNPLGWEKKSLKEVCIKLNDGTHFSPESFETGEYKYVTAKNIKMSGFDFTNITYVPEEVHRPIYERCNPELGDVLYIKDGVTTGIAMVNTLDEEFTLLSSVALLKQDRRIMNEYFLTALLNNENMYTDIRSNMGGAAITRLTIAKLNGIQVILPPMELQNQFATFVKQTDKSKLAVQKSLEELETLKKSLMQQYFG